MRKIQRYCRSSSRRICLGACVLLICVPALMITVAATETTAVDGQGPSSEQHRDVIKEWRQKRHDRLASEDGWLTLIGLKWLQEGENRVGKSHDNHIQIDGGPDYWGSVYLQPDGLRFVRAAGNEVSVDGQYPEEVTMVADTEGEPTLVKSGNLSFHPIFRESYALRIKDSQAPGRINFSGVENYEIQRDWRISGRLIPAEEGATIEIGNVLGQLYPSLVAGRFEFERNGKTHQLIALGDADSESLWIIFGDRTNNHETYGAGRFLYSDGLAENGWLVLDFNKSYNPPCAFNEYSTCPLPPQENRLDLMVTAGERDYHVE
jgi:uncharacterized protein (DUF1684 family)